MNVVGGRGSGGSPSSTFFGRLRAFDLECPACGEVYRINAGINSSRAGSGSRRADRRVWNPRISRFQCATGCGRIFVLGIIAWSPQQGQPVVPVDHVPTPRQALALRQQAGGRWSPQKLPHPPAMANRLEGVWWAAQEGPQEALGAPQPSPSPSTSPKVEKSRPPGGQPVILPSPADPTDLEHQLCTCAESNQCLLHFPNS